MSRITAGTAASLFAALVIGGPLASSSHAAPAAIQCATASPPAACALLDDLSAQLGPIAPVLGGSLAPLTAQAQGFAARSDQPAGVPTAEVVDASSALLGQLGALPDPVESLIGATPLGQVTTTLQAIVDQLTAPATGGQQSSGTTKPTPARTSPTSSAPSSTARSTGSSSLAVSSSTDVSSSAPSSAAVPDVPVGNPLNLSPLALPDFGVEAFAPIGPDVPTGPEAAAAQVAAVAEQMDGPGKGPEAEVVGVVLVSLLLLAGAGVAEVQANRHQIPD